MLPAARCRRRVQLVEEYGVQKRSEQVGRTKAYRYFAPKVNIGAEAIVQESAVGHNGEVHLHLAPCQPFSEALPCSTAELAAQHGSFSKTSLRTQFAYNRQCPDDTYYINRVYEPSARRPGTSNTDRRLLLAADTR